ncbi:MAG: aminoacetone oxidase family FAD-binding enzyme [Chloroflexi bacterium]|nr:aminoacetone oxidase family FAD-binding enzyme [Chloroflexota bacterium]
MKIAIIGAGASGMAAALQAAWHGGEITLFERNATIGRKLLVTGSGRCNLTNDAVTASKYACADSNWMAILLKRFGVSELIDMLAEICVPVRKTADGWYYPLSDSAHTVVEAFASALHQADVALFTSTQVTSIKKKKNGFAVSFIHDDREQEAVFEQVIISAGGKAYPSLGSRGELFPVLEELGHTVLPKRPALAPLLIDLGKFKSLQGIRLNVGATLWDGSRQLAFAAGNLIFTPWGLNGPAVMDISHHVSTHPNFSLELSLNWLFFFQEEFNRLLEQKRFSSLPLRILLGAFFPPKVVAFLLKDAHLTNEISLQQVNDITLERLVGRLKDTRLPIKSVRGFEYCQVSAGGIPVTEADPQTLESRRVKGLFLTGETLDVVGPCGGYNLQYAFSSGALAGRASVSSQ